MDSKNYYRKYLKYKSRYLDLKNSQFSQYGTSRKNDTIIKNEKTKAKEDLVEYITLLYQVLNDLPSCFIKGSFVIDDNNNVLKPILEKAQSTKPIPMTSHTGFGPYKGKDKICKKTNGLCEVNLQNHPVTIACEDHSLERRNIKWYTFNNTEEENNPQRFIFFKLEGDSTFTIQHMKSAINRYVRKTKEKLKLKLRREDCHLEGNCTCDKKGCSGDPRGYTIDGHPDTCSLNKETHQRIGDEFFISTELNTALLGKKSVKECRQILDSK